MFRIAAMKKEEQPTAESSYAPPRPWWVSVVNTVGVSTVILYFLGGWARDTVQWERDKFMDALLQNQQVSMQTVKTLESVRVSLDQVNHKFEDSERRAAN